MPQTLWVLCLYRPKGYEYGNVGPDTVSPKVSWVKEMVLFALELSSHHLKQAGNYALGSQ